MGARVCWALTCDTFQKPSVKHGKSTVLFHLRRESGYAFSMNHQERNAYSSFSNFQKIYIPPNICSCSYLPKEMMALVIYGQKLTAIQKDY